MKNIKINTILPIFILVILLILSSFNSFGLSIESNNINNNTEKNNSSSSSSIRVKSQSEQIYYPVITKEPGITQNLAISSAYDTNNIVIANTLTDESYPSLVIKGIKGLIAYESKEGTKPFIYLRNTENFGQSWSNAFKFIVKIGGIQRSVNSPSLSINPNNGYGYGAFLTEYNNSGLIGVFKLTDISELNNVDLNLWDWSTLGKYSFWSFKDITINYQNNNNAPWITSFIGSTNYSNSTGVGPCKNAVMYGYLGLDPDEMWIQWEPKFGNCSNLSVTMSDDNKKIYGISEIMKGSNIDLLFFSGVYKTSGGDPYLDLAYYNFTGPESLYHPKIFVKGNNIYIAAENNLQEIILYISTNLGKDWTMYNVTSEILPPGSNPKYPLLYVDATSIYCTFIESGNISITTSISGINWTDPVKLNDVNKKVVSNYRFSYMFDKNYIVWTDSRNGNYDLYSFIGIIPEIDLMVKENVYITSLGYPFLQTKNMINFTIANVGLISVEDVDIKVIYRCINKEPIETEYPGYITFLESGAEKSFNQYLFRINLKEFFKALISFSGIQNITVIVDPEKKYDDKNFKDNSVTIPVNYNDIFPLLTSFK